MRAKENECLGIIVLNVLNDNDNGIDYSNTNTLGGFFQRPEVMS